jgi:hypothetical protein
MGKKLDSAISDVYVLTIEAFDRSDNRGSEYDFGYTQGLLEAMKVLRRQQTTNQQQFRKERK